MSLSIEQATRALTKALKNKEHKVIALSGPWGTGKTHLWDTIKPSLRPGIIEVTAFGAKSIQDLKMRLLQSYLDSGMDGAGTTVNEVLSFAKGALKKFTGIDAGDAHLLALPTFTRNKLILIDDIERKHKSFEADELLGFINEFSEKYSTRFLLVLNTQKLDDNATWQTLREKVIDTEFSLSPTSDEAFAIACPGNNKNYLKTAKKAAAQLEISNIRILKKIITSLNSLFAEQEELSPNLCEQIIPYTTLMIAAYHRGIECGITLEYIENFHWGKSEPKNDEDAAWRKIISKIGYFRDQFPPIIAHYLRTGEIQHDAISEFLAPRRKNSEKNRRSELVKEFLQDFQWCQSFSREKLLDFHKLIEPHFYEIDSYDATSICTFFTEYGEFEKGEALIDTWVTAARSDPTGINRLPYGSPPTIHEKIHALKGELKPPTGEPMTLLAAIDKIKSQPDETSAHEQVLLISTAEQYIELIPSLNRENLKDFIDFHLRIASQCSTRTLTIAFENFSSAYKAFSNLEQNAQLVRIIEREASSRNIDLDVFSSCAVT